MTELSPSQSKVLTVLVQTGGSNNEIARDLGLSVATVKGHMGSLFRVASVDNRVKLVLWAQRRRVQPKR